MTSPLAPPIKSDYVDPMTAIPDYIRTLARYEPGKSISELQQLTGAKEIIKLASNENPLGPSPKAREAILEALDDIHRYPDGGNRLIRVLAKKYSVKPENIVLGGGSDSLMLSIVRAFVTEGGEVVTSQASFAQYLLMPKSRGAIVKTAPTQQHRYDLRSIRKLINDKTQLVFLANPNNPTGTMYNKEEWEFFYESLPKDLILVADEAYAEFVQDDPTWPNSLHYRHDNVITLRTFSKAYGLAGIRLGFGVGSAPLLEELRKVKLPFDPSVIALAAGEGALEDVAFLKRYLEFVKGERVRFCGELQKAGIDFVPSVANFIMVDLKEEKTAERIFKGLLSQGIIVRWLKAFGLPSAFRISIGLPEENQRCLTSMRELLRVDKEGA